GPGSELLLGEQATERRVKTANLERFSLLHFATHALVDEANPERSAVVLAPGSDEEDGLLQVREITALRLAPCAVVLAACSTSSGRVVQGEGVLGLARAFFEAGARVVVGTRWPVRDDASEQLFDGFYRRLPGRSVSEAMLEARRERIRAGAPAADWAALVVLGDGGVRLPAPGLLAGRWVWLGAGLLGVVLLGSVLVVRRQRRGTLGSASPRSR
ncbi:MAG TPA: CHAT domain-containing protein, partial [Myxococcaceae bacterium]|nr:CHAT domain-containing protein [Myxococcaceae bacterium]